jgi:hypothetical protein
MTSRPRIAHIGQTAFRSLRGIVQSGSPANDSCSLRFFGTLDCACLIENKTRRPKSSVSVRGFFAHLRGIMFDTILAVD